MYAIRSYYVTKGQFYLVNADTQPHEHHDHELTCAVCENAYEPEDMAHCPAYGGHICSLCCSLDVSYNFV